MAQAARREHDTARARRGPAGDRGRRHAVADTTAMVLGGAGGLALVTSVLLPWPGHGHGSTMAAHRVGDLLLADVAAAWVPSWIGLLVYVVPAGGAVVMISSGLAGRLSTAGRWCGLVPAATMTVATIALMPRRDLFDLGAGAVVAVAGAVLVGLSLLVDAWSRHADSHPFPADDRHHHDRPVPADHLEDPCSA